MKTYAEVAAWFKSAAEEFDDPSDPICQLFIRWQDDIKGSDGIELVCGWVDGELVLFLGPDFPPLPVRIETGPFQLDENDAVKTFGADKITTGVWAINPSLNAEGLIHAFLVLYGVPEPAPWERRIVLLDSCL